MKAHLDICSPNRLITIMVYTKQRLREEAEDRAALEERVKARLDDAGEEGAAEAVAGWEAKYARLKARYRVSSARLQTGACSYV